MIVCSYYAKIVIFRPFRTFWRAFENLQILEKFQKFLKIRNFSDLLIGYLGGGRQKFL